MCGNSAKQQETIDNSSCGRELGFNKSKPTRKTGVASCSSFTYSQDPGHIEQRLRDGAIVVDQYGREYTLDEFVCVLDGCPVRFTHSVGREFC
jgi:hypothetical protein